jgi:hypothetical protein
MSRIELRKVERSMFPDMLPLLSEHDSSLGEAIWRNTFFYPWSRDEPICGYALFEGNQPVGFLGFIFITRRINGVQERFCNVHTWYVRPAYRGHSLSLLRPLLRMQDITVTDLTPAPDVSRILERFGFLRLESRFRMMFPLPEFGTQRQAPEITRDAERLEGILDVDDLKIFRDHQVFEKCKHLALISSDTYCYMVYTVTTDSRMGVCHIHYVSDTTIFSENGSSLVRDIMVYENIYIVIADSRLLGGAKVQFCMSLSFHCDRYYKSTRLEASQIDNLYSELVLLNLGIYMESFLSWWQIWDGKHRLWKRFRQVFSRSHAKQALHQ